MSMSTQNHYFEKFYLSLLDTQTAIVIVSHRNGQSYTVKSRYNKMVGHQQSFCYIENFIISRLISLQKFEIGSQTNIR